MKLRRLAVVLNCAWLLCGTAPGAESPPGEVSLGVENGCVRVPIYVFDHWRWFALDTASEVTTLHSTFTNHLRSVPSATADVLREKTPFANFYIGQKFYLGKLEPFPKYFLVSDLTPLEHLSGVTVDGSLALDVLTNYQVTLDFVATNALFRTNAAQPESGGLPFKLEGNAFAFPASLDNGKHLLLTVDTMNAGQISLNPEDWLKAFPGGPQKTNRVMLADRRGMFSEKAEARLPALKIGDETYTNLVCTRLSDKSASSVVGSKFLRQHRVKLDYPNRQIRFQRLRDRTPTEPDMSGIHLKWIRQSAVIASIDPDSPAANVGLAEGDELLRIDGQLVMRLGSGGIENLFQRGDNVTLEIVVLHGPAEITKSIVLKRRI